MNRTMPKLLDESDGRDEVMRYSIDGQIVIDFAYDQGFVTVAAKIRDAINASYNLGYLQAVRDVIDGEGDENAG